MQKRSDTAAPQAANAAEPPETFLRLPQVLARVPVSKSTLWGWVRAGKFPKPIKLGPMTTVWRESDVSAWTAAAARQVAA